MGDGLVSSLDFLGLVFRVMTALRAVLAAREGFDGIFDQTDDVIVSGVVAFGTSESGIGAFSSWHRSEIRLIA